MGNDNSKETVEKLLQSAKKEFIEKGYMKASLRNICKDAGVTTGALYFFFKDKDDLFRGVVGEPLRQLHGILQSHMLEEMEELKSYTPGMQVDLENDKAVAIKVIKLLFQYKEDFELVITKSQGSSLENVMDEIADQLNIHYSTVFCAMRGYASKKQMTKEDKFIVHWMAHDQVDIFIHLLTHCKNEKEALRQFDALFGYIIGGWYGAIKSMKQF